MRMVRNKNMTSHQYIITNFKLSYYAYMNIIPHCYIITNNY